jgi:quinolinate synthase
MNAATRPAWTADLMERYAEMMARAGEGVPCLEWPFHLPWIDAIEQLKRERGAVIMAHSYQSPEIFHGVADITGDSLALAQAAADSDAEIIVLCGVHFMAETAKILAPNRTVLIPDLEAGCSLASSITAQDIRDLRAMHPGAPVVTYVNTSAAVKAESDACCTSANALQVVEAMGADKVIFLPDQFLGRHVASMTDVELVLWRGRCEVHEQFTSQQVRHARERFDALVVAHPECPPDVLAEADFVGSTTAMGNWLQRERPARVALITECSMGDNLRTRFPQIEFVKPCNLCPHMKRITLPKIFDCLRDLQHPVEIDAEVAVRARAALERMLAVGRRDRV